MTACLLHVGQLLGSDGAHQGSVAVLLGGNIHVVDEDEQGQALDAGLHQGWTRYLIHHLTPTYERIIFPNKKSSSKRPLIFISLFFFPLSSFIFP